MTNQFVVALSCTCAFSRPQSQLRGGLFFALAGHSGLVTSLESSSRSKREQSAGFVKDGTDRGKKPLVRCTQPWGHPRQLALTTPASWPRILGPHSDSAFTGHVVLKIRALSTFATRYLPQRRDTWDLCV
jgi:hypothetical protein